MTQGTRETVAAFVETLRGWEKAKALTEDWAESEAFGKAASQLEHMASLEAHWRGVANGLLRTMREAETKGGAGGEPSEP